MKLEVTKNIEELTRIAHEWDDLLSNSSADNPFQSFSWLQAWWHVYGSGSLYVLLCRDENTNRLVGGLPLYISNVHRFLPIKALRILGSGKGSADFLGCLALKGMEQKVYEQVIKHLFEGSRVWDLIELLDMDSVAPFSRFLAQTGIGRMIEETSPAGCCPSLQLPDSWEVLVKGLSKKVRQRIGYYRRALEKLGTVELERISDREAMPLALRDMLRLRRDRLDQKGISATLVTDEYQRFHSQLMSAFLHDNRLQLFFLRLNGQRIAYMYLFSGGKSLYFYQTGFDREWSKHSIGFVLLGMVMEQAIADGYSSFEFLRGEEQYKYEWGKVKERELKQFYISSSGLAVRFYMLIKKCVQHIRQLKCAVSGFRARGLSI